MSEINTAAEVVPVKLPVQSVITLLLSVALAADPTSIPKSNHAPEPFPV
jgi:hypothetical protein